MDLDGILTPFDDKRAIKDSIIKQISFYFSDSNLAKDKFLIQRIKESEEGWVGVGVIGSFKKMKSITLSYQLIVQAVREGCDLCEISSDGQFIRRKIPFQPISKDYSDDRTIYVDNYNVEDIDHDKIHELFKSCGNITHISLPRFKGKPGRDFKGFAFIEFDSIGAVHTAKDMNKYDHITNKDGLRVIPKNEWFHQKNNILNLSTKVETDNSGLLLTAAPLHKTITVQRLKDILEMAAPFAYIDLILPSSEEESEIGKAVIRYKSSTEAQKAIKFFDSNNIKFENLDIKLVQLSPEEEVTYWKMLEEIREKKKKNKKKVPQQQPVKTKIFPPSMQSIPQLNVKKMHMRFVHEEEEEKDDEKEGKGYDEKYKKDKAKGKEKSKGEEKEMEVINNVKTNREKRRRESNEDEDCEKDTKKRKTNK